MFRNKRKNPDTYPLSSLSIYDRIHLGIFEDGAQADLPLIYRNILLGGEPGAGKSGGLNNIVGHAALCTDARLCLFDGKEVELGLWREVADMFVGPDIAKANDLLHRLQREMDRRYAELARIRRRKITRNDPVDVIVVVIDEIALYSATIGAHEQQDQFTTLLRDLVARGRAAGIIVVAATQRPSADIIPTSLRDLFAYRVAYRCTTDSSSDTILGRGCAQRGFTATDIAPEELGVNLLLAEGGVPRRMRSAYLTDDDIQALVDYAHYLRNGGHNAA